ncbi:hypothetical protein C8Q77DRAFT_671723 [Trametes polyzona]|nr:hypothetical protein C8Q77DRAFT_671723 [Trametes polyzona]
MSSNDLYRMPSSCPNVSMLLDHLVTLVPGEHVLYVRSVQPLPLYPETDWQLESSTRAEPVVGILPIYLITSRTHASQAMRESPRYEGEDFVSALNAPYVQQPDMVVKYKYNRAVLAERNEGDVVVWADDLFTMIKNFLQLHRQLYAQYLHGIPDKLQNAEIQTAMKERVLPGRASSSDTNVVSQYQPRVPVDSPMLYDGLTTCHRVDRPRLTRCSSRNIFWMQSARTRLRVMTGPTLVATSLLLGTLGLCPSCSLISTTTLGTLTSSTTLLLCASPKAKNFLSARSPV